GEIDLPYLQLVLDRLYESARARGGDIHLRTAELEQLGALEDVLFEFVQSRVAALASPDLGEAALKLFVTARGTRNAVTPEHAARALHSRWPAATAATIDELFAGFVA